MLKSTTNITTNSKTKSSLTKVSLYISLFIIGVLVTACGRDVRSLKIDNSSLAGRVKFMTDLRLSSLFDSSTEKLNHLKLRQELSGFEMTVNLQSNGQVNLAVLERDCLTKDEAMTPYSPQALIDTIRYDGGSVAAIGTSSYLFNVMCIPTETKIGFVCSHYVVAISKAYGVGEMGTVLVLMEQSLTTGLTRSVDVRDLPEQFIELGSVESRLAVNCAPTALIPQATSGVVTQPADGSSSGVTGNSLLDSILDPLLDDAQESLTETSEEWYERVFGNSDDDAESTAPVAVPVDDPSIYPDFVDTTYYDNTEYGTLVPVGDLDPYHYN